MNNSVNSPELECEKLLNDIYSDIVNTADEQPMCEPLTDVLELDSNITSDITDPSYVSSMVSNAIRKFADKLKQKRVFTKLSDMNYNEVVKVSDITLLTEEMCSPIEEDVQLKKFIQLLRSEIVEDDNNPQRNRYPILTNEYIDNMLTKFKENNI